MEGLLTPYSMVHSNGQCSSLMLGVSASVELELELELELATGGPGGSHSSQ